jgi:hypothetical protein
VISRTVVEQQRALYWHRRRLHDREVPRMLLRETDQLMFWLEECLVQRLKIVPGWLMPRLMVVLQQAHPELPRELGRERRPEQVMEFVYRAQEALMEQAVKARRPAKIIRLFR